VKFAVFRYVAPCNLLDTERCSRVADCLHYQGDDEGSSETSASVYQTILLNIP
jgi:hypothetical protein